VQASEALKAFVKTLVKRAELLKTTRIDPRVDNMLRSPARAARQRWIAAGVRGRDEG
jgi:hypothetical protein